MRRALIAVALTLIMGQSAYAADERLVVVELFTSQGCYSCPPADRFAGKLRQRKDVLPLSYHVDYWDYIGWKDPFALPGNDERQRDYAASFGLHSIYTPQMIVAGQSEGVGSNERLIEKLISDVQQNGRFEAAPEMTKNGDGSLRVDLPQSGFTGSATILMVAFQGEKTQVISRGENAGKTLTYYNVVRKIQRLGLWNGEARQFDLGLPADLPKGTDGCAILIQDPVSGAIIGATRMNI
ncbi:DUF1223 domain-containing protein [Alphaproteobacteria bacterium HT1-32]|nr:DUF1223 domain-containing protein [Alphaproteobacteria bacterium HT1-32]|tara:strand:- start:2663 stop:3379 length:717 start_codon:yes stop_codon:yes gene_type:complete